MNIFSRDEISPDLFAEPELNLAQFCTVNKFPQPWFCLGENTRDDKPLLKKVVHRETMLLNIDGFQNFADRFDSIGAVVRNLGRPTAWSSSDGGLPNYRYVPFYSYENPFDDFRAEPLAFIRNLNGDLVINPDLWLFLELTEKREPQHIWYDSEKHTDVIQILHDEHSKRILIKSAYLQKYLRSRQLQLVVSEYRQNLFYSAALTSLDKFAPGRQTFVSKDGSAKAVIESWGPKNDLSKTYFVRRMQLWSVVSPPPINLDDPFADIPCFDLASFVLPTKNGPVAPARFLGSQVLRHNFEGTTCDFMDRVYFTQEVLVKYQNLPDHEISDDGAVRHGHFWSFDRSALRFNDDYLSIAIGDFAEGVDKDEWQHWQQFAVDPPDDNYFEYSKTSKHIVGEVNRLVSELYSLNEAFEYFCLKVAPVLAYKPLWKGAGNRQAITELKWFFPSHANEAEFRKRATLLSTLVIDDLDPELLRILLNSVNALSAKDSQLGSIKLLQRLALVAMLLKVFRKKSDLKALIELSSSKTSSFENPEFATEAQRIGKRIYNLFTPLFGLYDLRVAAGYAHPPSSEKVVAAAKLLELPERAWGRTEYLVLLGKLITCVSQISELVTESAQSLKLNDV